MAAGVFRSLDRSKLSARIIPMTVSGDGMVMARFNLVRCLCSAASRQPTVSHTIELGINEIRHIIVFKFSGSSRPIVSCVPDEASNGPNILIKELSVESVEPRYETPPPIVPQSPSQSPEINTQFPDQMSFDDVQIFVCLHENIFKHIMNNALKCDNCGKGFHTAKILSNHCLDAHFEDKGSVKYECLCGNTFETEKELKDHMEKKCVLGENELLGDYKWRLVYMYLVENPGWRKGVRTGKGAWIDGTNRAD